MYRRVALRYLLSKEQLGPSLHHIEQLVDKELWPAAKEAIQLFGRHLGVILSGTADVAVNVRTEWFSALDASDQNVFLSFVQTLRAVADVVWPRAIGSKYVREYEKHSIAALFRELHSDISAVEDMRRDDTDAHRHGAFLLIPTKGVHDVSEAVATLDAASGHIHGKFPKVLYGKVYIRPDVRPKGTYDPRPGSGGLVAGSYQAASDTIMLSMYARPERNSVMTLIHEFGHRYHTRFLLGDKREEFVKLSTVGDVQEEVFPLAERERFADEWLARSRKFRDDENFMGPAYLSPRAEEFFTVFPRDEFKSNVSPHNRKFNEGDESVVPALKKALARAHFGGNLRITMNEKDLTPLYASNYGSHSWEENFAESFLAFCMGTALPPPLHKFMASL